MPKGIPKNGRNKGWFKKGIKHAPVSDNTRLKLSILNTGKIHSEETKLKISKNRLGKALGNKNAVGHKPVNGFKKGFIPWNKGLQNVMPKKEKHPRWKGGLPKCEICNIQLKFAQRKKCRSCWLNFAKGKNAPNWKGGINSVIKRRAILAQAKGIHSLEEWEELKLKFDYMCLCCKQKEPFIKLTEDHIVPLSLGGDNFITNIQPLCQSCNSIKHTKIISFINQNVEFRT